MDSKLLKGIGSAARFAVLALLLAGISAAPLRVALAADRTGGAAVLEAAWTRNLEPVVTTAASLPAFLNAPIDDLFGYALVGSSWQQIPFQVDEVNAEGAYEAGDGLLDANDELVFMAKDGGSQAGIGDWLANADAQAHTRYEMRLTNPLAPSEKTWAYLYRSATLSPAAQDYVDWEPGSERVVAEGYVAGYSSEEHTGLDSLELNQSGVDALDRTKLRVYAKCAVYGMDPNYEMITEEDDRISWSLIPSVDGRVRVGGGTTSAGFWSYASYYESDIAVDLTIPPDPACDEITVEWMRTTNDWRDPDASGMAPATYYDDNTPGGVPIDGVEDSVATAPVNEWKEISGALGTLVQVQDLSITSGTITNYYGEHGTEWEPAPPSGDGLQFGDAGFRVDLPEGTLHFATATFILPAAQPNVGAAYRAYHENPIQVALAAQELCWAQGVRFGYVPIPAFQGVELTLTAHVEQGQQPFSYAWDFGDGSTAQGNPVTHTYAGAGVYPVTVSVTNACGTVEVTRGILVHDAQVFQVFVPLGVRAGQ